MAAIPQSQVMKITLQYSLQQNRLTSSFWYAATSVLDASFACPQLVADFLADVMPAWEAAVSNQVRFERLYATMALPESGLTGEYVFPEGSTGARAVEALPSNMALVIQCRQTEVTSKANGRSFISGLCETDQVDGLFAAALLSSGVVFDLLTHLQQTLSGGPGPDTNIAVLQRNANGAPITPVGYLCDQVLAARPVYNQRRRLTERLQTGPPV